LTVLLRLLTVLLRLLTVLLRLLSELLLHWLLLSVLLLQWLLSVSGLLGLLHRRLLTIRLRLLLHRRLLTVHWLFLLLPLAVLCLLSVTLLLHRLYTVLTSVLPILIRGNYHGSLRRRGGFHDFFCWFRL
jgi:hypothetical protein